MSLFSRAKSSLAAKEKKVESMSESRRPTPPPKYPTENAPVEDFSSTFRKLNIRQNNVRLPSNHECTVHLKFLNVLANLRKDISENDGLFGIHDFSADAFYAHKEKAITKIREKRWGVYVARAVDRFEAWFGTLPTSTVGSGSDGYLRMSDIVNDDKFDRLTDPSHSGLVWTPEFLPPLDVLMVLHSFMLNPRSFLEDCVRQNRMMLWHAGFPWLQVDACINPETLIYTPNMRSAANFEAGTSRSWDSLHDPPFKSVVCPGCGSSYSSPWTDTSFGTNVEQAFESGRGFADLKFQVDCTYCRISITHETLRLIKFGRDVERLQKNGLPLAGTVLSVKGMLVVGNSRSPKADDFLFPNRLVLVGLGNVLNSLTHPHSLNNQDMTTVRTAFEQALTSRHLVSRAKGSRYASKSLDFDQKVSIRRMMSRYWENSSPFALDLVGAVLRQGVFINKMRDIDWIHSPALQHTISRLLQKYTFFFGIIAENPGRVAVPTLDVDLAWHTHQLVPSAYYAYSVHQTKDVFVDHDDKIAESKLSSAFEWTSKRYQKMTGGQIYAECTCWYCEAIRESHNNQSLFSSQPTTMAKLRALELYDRENVLGDPRRSVHISAHNAVQEQSAEGAKIASRQRKKLLADYNRACYKATSAGKQPHGEDDFAVESVWGCPMYIPQSAPFAADPCISGSMYPCNPVCMNTAEGASGNCVAGACGGAVSFGGSESAGACGSESAGAGGVVQVMAVVVAAVAAVAAVVEEVEEVEIEMPQGTESVLSGFGATRYQGDDFLDKLGLVLCFSCCYAGLVRIRRVHLERRTRVGNSPVMLNSSLY